MQRASIAPRWLYRAVLTSCVVGFGAVAVGYSVFDTPTLPALALLLPGMAVGSFFFVVAGLVANAVTGRRRGATLLPRALVWTFAACAIVFSVATALNASLASAPFPPPGFVLIVVALGVNCLVVVPLGVYALLRYGYWRRADRSASP